MPTNDPINPELDVRQASVAEIQRACRDPELEVTISFTKQAIAREDLCVAAFHNDKMVAYSWIGFHGAPHGQDLFVEVSSPYVYIYKSFCLEEYRGLALMRDIGWERDRIVLARGGENTLGFIELHNRPSLRAYAKAGGTVIGYAGFARLLGRLFLFRTPGAAKHQFRFRRLRK
ncbi:MAG: hypothetical protein AAGL69_03445 [Pseudomonadota bacterium]